MEYRNVGPHAETIEPDGQLVEPGAFFELDGKGVKANRELLAKATILEVNTKATTARTRQSTNDEE